jgi:EmrB/QacA subfamily drug resistance transporter
MSRSPTPADTDALDPHIKRIAIVVVLGMIASILDMTIVNVALDSLSRDLHTSLASVQWVVSAYLLALAAVIPLAGWSVKKFGAFRVYMYALVLFTAGSALCGMAQTSGELIAFRALQGLGGGLLAPTGMTILVKATGRDKLARVMAAMGVPMVLAPVMGPTLGGFLLQSVSWHAIFLVNVPVGIVSGIVAIRLLPRDQPEPDAAGRLDWQGLVIAAAGTVGVTYGLSQSASAGSFTSPSVVLPILLGCVFIAGFIVRSRRLSNPLLDLTLYSVRTYRAATGVMFCMGAVSFGAMLLLPLFFQDVRGEDAFRTGLLLIPQGFGGAMGMNRSAVVQRKLGAGLTTVVGLAILVAATVPFLFVGPRTSYLTISAVMVIRGVGVALAAMPAMTAAFAALSHEQVGDASPQLNIIQRVGGSLGTAIVAVVLQGNLDRAVSNGHTSAVAMAHAFNRTYLWVMVISIMAFVPGVMLWRLERRLGVDNDAVVSAPEQLMEIVT